MRRLLIPLELLLRLLLLRFHDIEGRANDGEYVCAD